MQSITSIKCITFAIIIFLFSLSTLTSAQVCEDPKVLPRTYTTTDGMVITSVAFIAEFSVSCAGSGKDYTLYADINGKTVPTMKSVDGTKYQVSWTEEVDKVRSGDFPIRIYDDEGFSALRKAQRIGDDSSTIKPLFTVTVNHSGTYLGPYVHSELVAVFVSILLWYAAYATKSKLQA